MELLDTLRRDWRTIVILVLTIILLTISFININWENPKFKAGSNWLWYSILCAIGIFALILIYHFIVASENTEKNKFVLEFLKMLLPTLLAILSLLYALSSGLFNIKNETLRKNKAILQHDINEFKNEKKIVFKELNVLQDSLFSAQNDLERTKLEINTFKKDIEEIKKESKEKSDAIEILNKLNVQYKEQQEKIKNNILEKINNFLSAKQIGVNVAFSIKCLGLYDEKKVLFKFYDLKGDILTDKEIIVQLPDGSGYPDHGPVFAQYNKEDKTFEIPHNYRIMRGKYITDRRNVFRISFKDTNDVIENSMPNHWNFELPFENAKYSVTIHRQ